MCKKHKCLKKILNIHIKCVFIMSLEHVWVPVFGKYQSPLMTRDLGPSRMDGWTGFGSPRPIRVVI